MILSDLCSIYSRQEALSTSLDTVDVNSTIHPFHSPVNRLPVELLVKLFRLVGPYTTEPKFRPVGCSWKFDGRHIHPDDKTGWVRLMLVCRHWRNVGVNAPHLWRTIFVTRNLESLKYRLEKSQGCTIDVIFNDSEYEPINTAALPFLLVHSKRIRSIKTSESFTFSNLHLLKPMFQVQLPSLERIEIIPKFGSIHSFYRGSRLATYDPNLNFSKTRQPRLRHLVAFGVTLPGSSSFWSLSTLVLALEITRDTGPQLALDVLALVRASTSLASLTITKPKPGHLTYGETHTGIAPSAATSTEHSHIELPHLNDINIRAPLSFASPFLHALRPLSPVSFRLYTGFPPDCDASSIADAINDLIPPGVREHIVDRLTRMYIGTIPCSGLRTMAKGFFFTDSVEDYENLERRRIREHDHVRADYDGQFNIEIARLISSTVSQDMLTTLSRSFSGNVVECLHILPFPCMFPECQTSVLAEVFSAYPRLRSLTLKAHFWNVQVALNYLAAHTTSNNDGDAVIRRLNLPSLEVPDSLRMCYVLEELMAVIRARESRGVAKFEHMRLILVSSCRGLYSDFRVHRSALRAIADGCESHHFTLVGRWGDEWAQGELFEDFEWESSEGDNDDEWKDHVRNEYKECLDELTRLVPRYET